MADNTTLNSGTGGDVIASDDIAGVKHQRVKVEFGADGSATDVSSANPLPVVLTTSTGVDIGDVTVANGTGASSVPVQGGAATDAAVAGNPLLAGARASAAAPTDMSADGDAVPLWATLKGALNVADGGGTLSVDDGGGALTVDGTVAVSGTVTVDASGATVPVSNAGLTELAAAINGSSQLDVNIAASAATLTVASHAVTNAGTFAVQATVAAGATNIAKAEDAASADADVGVPAMAVRKATPANTSGADGDYEMLQMSAGRLWTSATVDAALPAGTNAIGKLAANSGVDIGDVDVTSIAAGSNLIGDVGLQPRTSGGLSFYKTIDLDETEEEVKATAGQVYSIYAFNAATTKRYLKVYNATAASVAVGTTTPDLTFVIPTDGSTGGGIFLKWPQGLAFGTAITIAATTGLADNDTGAPAANDVIVMVGYK